MFEISPVGLWPAFVAGIISFLSPCVLPLVPGYVSYVAGQSLENIQNQENGRGRFSVLALSLCFILGFSTVFVMLGTGATALGQLLLKYRYEANLIGATVVIVFGLFFTGLLRVPWLYRDLRFHGSFVSGHPAAAYAVGLAFAFGWTPCIGPVLGTILTISAASPGISNGTALLAVYSLGLGVPFLAAALFMGALLIHLKALRRLGRLLQIGAGAVMIVMGIAMLTGQLTAFAYWFLELFPVLGELG